LEFNRSNKKSDRALPWFGYIRRQKCSRNIHRYKELSLTEPHKLFRRVRVEGKLVLSKAAKAYPPGSGVYRSSYKNALRLSANETNLAYRLSDFTRRQQMPFVTGIEVHLSASHEIMDMCFISGQYRILTSKGWIPIYKIKENSFN